MIFISMILQMVPEIFAFFILSLPRNNAELFTSLAPPLLISYVSRTFPGFCHLRIIEITSLILLAT